MSCRHTAEWTTAPCILKFTSTRRCVVGFTPPPIHPWVKARKPLNQTPCNRVTDKLVMKSSAYPVHMSRPLGPTVPSWAWRVQTMTPHPTALWFILMQGVPEVPVRLCKKSQTKTLQVGYVTSDTKSQPPSHLNSRPGVMYSHSLGLLISDTCSGICRSPCIILPLKGRSHSDLSSLQIYELQFRVHFS